MSPQHLQLNWSSDLASAVIYRSELWGVRFSMTSLGEIIWWSWINDGLIPSWKLWSRSVTPDLDHRSLIWLESAPNLFVMSSALWVRAEKAVRDSADCVDGPCCDLRLVTEVVGGLSLKDEPPRDQERSSIDLTGIRGFHSACFRRSWSNWHLIWFREKVCTCLC